MVDGWVVNREGIWWTREKGLGGCGWIGGQGQGTKENEMGGVRDGGGWVINGNE